MAVLRDPIRTFVISLGATGQHVDALRQAFPDVDFQIVDSDDLPAAMERADAVAAGNIPVSAISSARNLKWIHRGAAGVEGLVTPEVRERGIILTNSSGAHASNMSEHVFAFMLSFARGFPTFARLQREHDWATGRLQSPLFELTDQTVTLAGVGDVGEAVAVRARVFGMSTIGVRRRMDLPRPDGIDTMLPMDRFHEALAAGDHVVNSLPLTPDTQGLFDAAAFDAMKEGAYFYNVGRGQTADTDALIAALESGKLAGAGLDVVDPEPLPSDSPLWDMPNVMITCHTSGRTPRVWERIYALIENNLERYRAGDELLNVVDMDAGY